MYGNTAHCHINLCVGTVNLKAFRNEQRKMKSFGPREHPAAQVLTHRPQIIMVPVQGEQNAKAASPQVSGRAAREEVGGAAPCRARS